MMKALLFFSCIVFCFSIHGQIMIDEPILRDSIRSRNLAAFEEHRLDSLYPEFIDTIEGTSWYLMTSWKLQLSDLYLVTPVTSERKSWLIYDLGYGASLISAERVEVNGKGSAELIIRTGAANGFSFQYNRWADRSENCYVVDLDSMQMIFDGESYYYREEQEMEDDGDWSWADTCINYQPAFSKGTISFTRMPSCNDFEENMKYDGPLDVVRYRYVNGIFVKEK